MKETLHITSGDCAGDRLKKSGIPGEIFVWHDILYDGPRNSGWPDENTLIDRSQFLEQVTGGGLDQAYVFNSLKEQYRKLAKSEEYDHIVLWFDACLFDQSMLVHILACLHYLGLRNAELLCIDKFPGITPFNGLGQLQADQLASCYDDRQPVTNSQFRFAIRADEAFATQNLCLLTELSRTNNAPIPWIPAAVTRWLMEKPNLKTGLGRLDFLIIQAIHAGNETPREILAATAAADTPPQFWGDTTLWGKINSLADRNPPLVQIEGPAKRLPQWESTLDLNCFRIRSLISDHGK